LLILLPYSFTLIIKPPAQPITPATKTTEVLFKKGNDFIEEEISGVNLKYYYDSFFQINPSAFESIIKYLKENIRDNKVLVDLYSGVGTIGFCLHKKFKEIHMVEFDKKASDISLENAKLNNIKNVQSYGGETEKQDLMQFLTSNDTLVVDPPRSGMHPKAIKQIIDIVPKNFIYISCNPFTQLRDMKEFSQKYRIMNWRLFDLYPQTPLLESVLILIKK
jgi:tRNA/tmRNA/rRNA uracil-C5-methylase (TrmA/RlmC/RlmD family)